MMHYGIKKMVNVSHNAFFPLFNPTMHQICGILLFEIGLNLMARWRNSWYIVLLNLKKKEKEKKKKEKKYGMQQIVSFGQWLEIWMCEGA